MKKIVYIDMDGVLADFSKGIGRPGYEYNPPEMLRPGFFRELEVMPGAKDAIAELLTIEGIDVFIATKPTTANLNCATEKFEWIKANFPELLRKIFITCDKGHLNGDYLIDDNANQWQAKFKGTFLHFQEFEPEDSWMSIVNYMKQYKINF